jgi:hypothetical protein
VSAPLNNDEYPFYFRSNKTLLAFVAKDKMFKVEAIGSNKNPGVTIDHYITRNMVLKHWPGTSVGAIDKRQFETLLKKLFDSYIDKILNY